MTPSKQRPYTNRFTARLSNEQFKHLKEMTNPSEYLRLLIARDMLAVQNAKA